MLVQFDCYKCLFNQVVEMARSSSDDNRERRKMLKRFISQIVEHADDFTPPEMASVFYETYCRETGIPDPFAHEKEKSTEIARQLYDELAETVAASKDPFAMALRFAIGGNVIDFGANPNFKLSEIVGAIRETAALPVDENALEKLRHAAANAGNILYMLDNCGEAVIDRLLIEQIGIHKITLGVRGKPILNDVTRAELAASGLADLPVIDTGDRTPGVSMRFSSPEFLQKLHSADLIIAKGQGNFESLGDVVLDNDIFFLFRVKCPVIRMQTGAPLGSLQIRQSFLHKDA
jgi:uncharacterized protein with ATP-grasp and redox domains